MGTYKDILLKQAKKNNKIFWDTNNIKTLSNEAILERILTHGDMNQFREVTKDTEGFKNVYSNILNKERNSLTPQVKNYVDLYLKKNE